MFQDMQRDKSTAAMRPNHRVQFNLKAKSPENPLLTDDKDYKTEGVAIMGGINRNFIWYQWKTSLVALADSQARAGTFYLLNA